MAKERVLTLSVTHGVCEQSNMQEPLGQSLYFQPQFAHKAPLTCLAILRDEWLHTQTACGDTIHLCGEWDQSAEPPKMTLTSLAPGTSTNGNLLVLHPDMVISASRLASVSMCMRRPMIQERVKAPSDTTYVAVLGNLVHGLLQACLTATHEDWDVFGGSERDDDVSLCIDEAAGLDAAPEQWTRLGDFSRGFVRAEVERQLDALRQTLLIVGAKTDDVRRDVYAAVPSLVAFASAYLVRRDGCDADELTEIIDARSSTLSSLQITRVLGVERDIVSPMYGLKGRVDVCVEAVLGDGVQRRVTLLPIEVKSGRATTSMEHVAQASLYTLLLSDTYGVPVDSALLLYVQTCEVKRVHRIEKEIRSLVLARNDMAAHKVRLPPLLEAEQLSTCEAEASEDAAATANVSSSPQDPATKAPSHDVWSDLGVSDEALAEVPTPDSFAEFDLSDADLVAALDAPPPMLPPTINDAYRCNRCYARDACMLYRRAVERVSDTESPIAALYASATSHLTPTDLSFFQHWDALLSHEERGLTRYEHELWTMSAHERASRGRCIPDLRFLDCDGIVCAFAPPTGAVLAAPFALEDLVVLGTHATTSTFLARARIVHLAPNRIELRTEAPFMEALAQAAELVGVPRRDAARKMRFRIDSDELSSMMGVPRYNVACLFYADAEPRTAALRARVVHLAAPRFAPSRLDDETTRAALAQHAARCNADQRAAVERVLCAQDYALVLGMPGTGKSTTISVLVRVLVALGQSVLLCSYTHSAVDTVLAKLADDDGGIDVLRIGAVHRIHPRVRRFALPERLRSANHALDETPDAAAAYDALVRGADVVAATCLATTDAAFARRAFDVCIVDEASQITVPTCLGPLRFADRFVMIGDHHQLAPLVRDAASARSGLQTSLFQRLCAAHPSAVVALETQFRMNADIMALTNALVYGGRLRCGSAQVASGCIKLHANGIGNDSNDSHANIPLWLSRVLAPSCCVIFCDTDALAARELRVDGLVENTAEAVLAARIVDALYRAGVADVGVLTPYRQQVRELRRACRPDIEVMTADQAQGRDWSVVVVSFVRSNADHMGGELLRDVRRLNVLLTRAKHKLVMLGSASTWSGAAPGEAPMQRLLGVLSARHALMALPSDALDGCRSGAVGTHVSPTKQRHVKTARVEKTRPVLAEVLNEADV